MANPVFKELTTSVIVNSVVLRTLKDDELAATMAAIYALGKPVVLASDILEYTSASRIKKHIDAGTIKPAQLEYYMARELTAEDQAIIDNYFSACKAFNNLLSLVEVVYPFAEVPANKNVDYIEIGANKITRIGNAISIDSFKRIWLKARPYWAGEVTTKPRSFSVQQIGTYSREVLFSKTDVTIGCTTIPRYEIEQLALRLELSFSE